SASRGSLQSVSATDAANLVTLCYVGGELIAFQNANLVAPSQYQLTTLYRGCFGTAIADHSAGTPFARIDGSEGRFPYPSTLIGQTIFLKFVSLNIVGGGAGPLDEAPVYSYAAGGAAQAMADLNFYGFLDGQPGAGVVLQRFVLPQQATLPENMA